MNFSLSIFKSGDKKEKRRKRKKKNIIFGSWSSLVATPVWVVESKMSSLAVFGDFPNTHTLTDKWKVFINTFVLYGDIATSF